MGRLRRNIAGLRLCPDASEQQVSEQALNACESLSNGATLDDVGAKAGEQFLGLGFEAGFGVAEIGLVDFHSDPVATAIGGSQKSSAGAHEGVQDSVACEREHSNEAVGQFCRKRGRVFPSGLSG